MSMILSKKGKRQAPRWATWAIVAGVWVFLLPFYISGNWDLALPSLLGSVAIGCAVATFWKHKKEMWLWIAAAATAAIHVCLIIHFEFDFLADSKFVFGIYALIDYGLIALLFKLVAAFFADPHPGRAS
jgi:hypothetical protein